MVAYFLAGVRDSKMWFRVTFADLWRGDEGAGEFRQTIAVMLGGFLARGK
jgi:hypothetical protein